MKLIKAILDEKSTMSSLRLMSIASLLEACILASYGVYTGKDLLGLAALCSVFVTAAFGSKVIQKKMENK